MMALNLTLLGFIIEITDLSISTSRRNTLQWVSWASGQTHTQRGDRDRLLPRI